MAKKEKDAVRQKELETIATVCARVPEQAPRNFHEALQHYWFVHLGVTTELNTWDSFNPGRLDQHLMPFYRQGLEEGNLSDEAARELLQAFWIKFNNQPAPPQGGGHGPGVGYLYRFFVSSTWAVSRTTAPTRSTR